MSSTKGIQLGISFGVVEWGIDDLFAALAERGYVVNYKNTVLFAKNIDDKRLVETMIAAGWDYIYEVIDDLEGLEEKQEEE